MIVARAHGRSLVQQVIDILRLTLRRRGMKAEDYYWFGLYDSHYSDADRMRFVGDDWCAESVRQTANSSWWGLASDKVLTYLVLSAHGFQVPKVTAILHPIRPYPGARQLRTEAELLAWLRTEAAYPQFAKPAAGIQSRGQSLLLGYDPETDTLIRKGEPPIGAAEYARLAAESGTASAAGFLFQDLLPHDSRLEPLIGPRLSGVRNVVVIDRDGPRILESLWKIPVGNNFADNYWRPGNLLALLDQETGEVRRVVTGSGADLEEVTRHPDTGAQLIGTRVPDWEAVRDLTLRGAAAFTKIRLQGWDVGICEGGPRPIEVNLGTGFKLMQIAGKRGFLTPENEAFLAWAQQEVAKASQA